MRREKGRGYTPDSMAKHNRKIRQREVAWAMHQNFEGGKDGHLNFTYPKGVRPSPEQAKRDFAAALDCMRKGMKKQGKELKYMAALGVGERGGIHLHMVTTCTDLALLRKAWPHGGVHIDPLWANGNFSGLGKYFVDQVKEIETGEEKIIVKIVGRWSGSRNLIRRPPKEEQIGRFSWREPPRPRKGYMIDIDSIDAGENPVTGIPYLFYRMVKIPQQTRPGERREMQETNRKAVRDVWDNNYVCRRVQKVGPGGCDKAERPTAPVPGGEEPGCGGQL